MNRSTRILRNGLGLLLLLVLAAGAAWLIVQSRPRPPQATGSPLPTPSRAPSPTPRQPGPPASPTPAATQVGQRVPLCTFPGGDPPDKGGPSLDQYEFSEPRVVLTGGGATIADWLPDSNRLLITRGNPQSRLEQIATLDVRTGEMQLYAERTSHYRKPVWLSAIQGVVYVDMDVGSQQFQLRTSRAKPAETETIIVAKESDIGLSFSLAVDPSGRHLLYVMNRTGGRLQSWDSVERTNQATPFDADAWRRSPPDLSQSLWQYMVVPSWSPDGTRLAVFVGPSSLFLVEPGPNRVCEVNLGRRWPAPDGSRWSPNARYLALITSYQAPDPLVRSTNVTVLDVLTGEVRELPLPTERGPIMDVSWGGNSRHLVVLAAAAYRQERSNETKLFLADVDTGDVRQMLPGHLLGGGASSGEQMAWAHNGRSLAITCPIIAESEPVITEDRLCLIATELRP